LVLGYLLWRNDWCVDLGARALSWEECQWIAATVCLLAHGSTLPRRPDGRCGTAALLELIETVEKQAHRDWQADYRRLIEAHGEHTTQVVLGAVYIRLELWDGESYGVDEELCMRESRLVLQELNGRAALELAEPR